VSLPEQDAFDNRVLAARGGQLQRLPKPRAWRVASPSSPAARGHRPCHRVAALAEGACVTLADVDAGSLEQAVSDLARSHGKDVVHGVA